MAQFYTLLTEIGRAKQANAIALQQPIEITQLAVGDGGGTLPTPQGDEQQLINEVRRAAINTSHVDPDNPSWIVVEQVIPPGVGGWTIREIGIIDSDGDLIGYGNYPETYKPVLDEGSSRTQTVRFVLEVSDTAAITLKIDPSVVLATREYVDGQRTEHEASRNHPEATEAEQGMARVADQAMVNTGANDARFVTPKKLKAWAVQWVKQASETIEGMLRLATIEETLSGESNSIATHPKGVIRSITEATKTIGTSGGDESDLTTGMQERISTSFKAIGNKVFVVFKCHIDHQSSSANDFEADLVLLNTTQNTVITQASAVATAASGGPYSAAAVLVTTFQYNGLVPGDFYKFSARLRKTTGNGPSYPRKMMIDGIQTR